MPSSAGGPAGGNRFAAGDDFKEQVRTHTDLVGLIGEKVRLQSRSGGRDWLGLCPFHDDNKPSFHVYPERGTYRCWACQEGGDCFSFVMATEKIDFREALELLARRAGLEMPTYGRPNRGPKRDKVLAALDWAAKQYAGCLHDTVGAAAMDYVRGRDFSDAIIESFRLGFHPAKNWTWLLDRARGRNIPIEVLDEANLIKKSQKTGDWIDSFVGRVLFPIRNERGQTVAFGGRVLPGDDEFGPKYLNSAETPYFSKSRVLFGLDVARPAIEKPPEGQPRRAVVVEGYTDCVTLHQYGLTEAVGVLGTALTDAHSRLLSRFAEQVVLVFDGDSAGQNAAQRSVATMLAGDLDVRVLVLPDRLDPDEYLKAHGVESLRKLLATATDLWTWRIGRAIASHGTDSIAARERVATELMDVLVGAELRPGQMRTEGLLRQLERPLQLSLPAIENQFRERASRGRRYEAAPSEQPAAPPARSRTRDDALRLMSGRANIDDRMEAAMLQGILEAPEDFAPDEYEIGPEEFTNVALGKLYRAADHLARSLQQPTLDKLLTILTVPDLKRLLVYLDDKRLEQAEPAEPNDQSEPPPAGADDESAQSVGRLLDSEPDHAQTRSDHESDEAIPLCLARPLSRMLRRREERSHQQISRELPAMGDAAGHLDSSEEALRKLAAFHAKRSGRSGESEASRGTPTAQPAAPDGPS